jgi:hypothetical protein
VLSISRKDAEAQRIFFWGKMIAVYEALTVGGIFGIFVSCCLSLAKAQRRKESFWGEDDSCFMKH